MSDFEARFAGVARLLGQEGLHRLASAHVCIVGMGGVGSWAVEALARSGVGELTLIDLDDVCVSNVNRQLPAMDGNFGRPKVEVMAERAKAINPDAKVNALVEFVTKENISRILEPKFNFVLDAIDGVSNKCQIIAACKERDIPAITAGGAGGRLDPRQIEIADLRDCHHDRLLMNVRKFLRTRFNFPRGKNAFGVECIFSPEQMARSSTCAPAEEEADNACNRYGTVSFVTGAFGLAAGGRIVQHIVSNLK